MLFFAKTVLSSDTLIFRKLFSSSLTLIYILSYSPSARLQRRYKEFSASSDPPNVVYSTYSILLAPHRRPPAIVGDVCCTSNLTLLPVLQANRLPTGFHLEGRASAHAFTCIYRAYIPWRLSPRIPLLSLLQDQNLENRKMKEELFVGLL